MATPGSSSRLLAESAFIELLARDVLAAVEQTHPEPMPLISDRPPRFLTRQAVAELRALVERPNAAKEWTLRHYLAAPCVERWASAQLRVWRRSPDFVVTGYSVPDDAVQKFSGLLHGVHYPDDGTVYSPELRAIGAHPHIETRERFLARAARHYDECEAWLRTRGAAPTPQRRLPTETRTHAELTLHYQATGSFAAVAESGHGGRFLSARTGRDTLNGLEAVTTAIRKFAALIELELRPARRGRRPVKK